MDYAGLVALPYRLMHQPSRLLSFCAAQVSGFKAHLWLQTIPVTFRHYVAPALANRSITDPVANLTAGINYMIANYGLDTVEAGGRSNSSGGYVGY